MKIVIIGGVAGGATAAARLRRLNELDELILIEKDEFISFANCGLPYHLGGVIENRDDLIVQSIRDMSHKYRLDIRNFSEVIAINPTQKEVTIRMIHSDKTYNETYDKLIISTGSLPIRPKLPNLETCDNVFVLTNIPTLDSIMTYLKSHDVKKAAVIGGGFIGLEVAENLHRLGIDVTIVEKLPQVMRPFDFEMAQILHQTLNRHGIKLLLGDGLLGFDHGGKQLLLDSGRVLDTDMTVLAIGVTPNNQLAKAANFQLGPRGHIIVNDVYHVMDAMTQQVNDDVYAIGDVIEVNDFVDNTKTAVPLAWPANRQARLVADHINNQIIKSSKLLGTSIIKLFDLTAASVGQNESQLKQKNMPYQRIYALRNNHASYYPNAQPMYMKLLYRPDNGKIYGAQIIGSEGVDKRIDILSTVMKTYGTVYDLSDLQLAYAPPYGSAKDPINILGYIAEDIKDEIYQPFFSSDVDALISENHFFLDVRSKDEYDTGHIKTALNIPLDELRQRLDEIRVPKNHPVYVNCESGTRSYLAICILKSQGYTNLHNLVGGFSNYRFYKYLPF